MDGWKHYIKENFEAMDGISERVVARFENVLADVRRDGGTVWVLGNGGSASTASHAAGDFGKTAKAMGSKPLLTLAPSEMTALQSAYANDVNFESAFAETLDDFLRPVDLVWIISVSGTSPNLLAAVDVAMSKGVKTAATVGTRGSTLADSVDVGVVIPSDDYQVVENVQLALMHWLTKSLQASDD